MPAATHAAVPRRRKRFGQHFLHDPRILDRIVQALAAHPGDTLMEIGPGRGALTERLLALRGCTLDAIEIDRDLAAQLRGRFEGSPDRALHEGDALEFDFSALARERGGRLRIVGNLPYNISTPLLFHLLRHAAAIADLTVTLQREVVARIAAAPGDRDYGRLSVMLAPHLEVVAAAFAQRRKTLRNALSQILTAGEISACAIDPKARPETLAPEAFNTLAEAAGRAALDRARGGR